MGLDWNPLGKPTTGCEHEFERIFCELEGRVLPPKRSYWARLTSRNGLTRGERRVRLARFLEISESPGATLNAPRVGFDREADEWFESYTQPEDTAAILREQHGQYLLWTLPDCDGFPAYSNGGMYAGVGRTSFRAQFLGDAAEMLGPLLERAYANMLASELHRYGEELLAAAVSFAAAHGLDLDAPEDDELDEESPAHQVSVVLSAARWAIFWGERGHGLEVWF